ncbi:MAG TPA: hypothetical protein ENL07_11950 [Chlorobaculum parvum]|uniref:Haem-binding domain-containing protein n=1 Tax=Chlorobaculum parvum TaxID=274539 RepID=A0A7C5DFU8_9CHLB|nr:hypothetical protein [Chlorobaculum parvum]
MPMKHPKTRLRNGAAWVVLALILCQFVPLDRFNQQPALGTAIPDNVRGVLEAQCFQCHSGQTNWPKTAYFAPLSWYVTGKVKEARKALNFSGYDALSDTARQQLRNEVAGFIKSTDLAHHGCIPGFPKIEMTSPEQQKLIDWSANNNR